MSENNGQLRTTDTQSLAREFLMADPECGMSEEELIEFFENAVQCGWDERTWQTKTYKALVRRSMQPWWSWKRYVSVRDDKKHRTA
jgi:hypothetical protein